MHILRILRLLVVARTIIYYIYNSTGPNPNPGKSRYHNQ
jgi:hypothetical protein